MYTFLIYGFTFITSIFLLRYFEISFRNQDKIPGRYLAITALIPSVTAALRYGIGVDYFSYVDNFYTVNSIGIQLALEKSTEPLYTLLYIISPNPIIFFFIAMFLSVYIMLVGANNFKNELSMHLVLVVYLLYYYIEGFNIVGQTIAISIVFYSFKYLLMERNFIKYIIIIFIATAFHNTAIIAIVFYFLPYKYNKSLKVKMITTLLMILFSLTIMVPEHLISFTKNLPVIGEYFELYNFSFDSSIYSTILRLGPFILTTCFLIPIIKSKGKFFLFLMIMLFSIGISPALMRIPYGWRIQFYLVVPQLFTSSLCIRSYTKKENKLLLYLLIIILYLAFFSVYYIHLKSGPGIPYKSIF